MPSKGKKSDRQPFDPRKARGAAQGSLFGPPVPPEGEARPAAPTAEKAAEPLEAASPPAAVGSEPPAFITVSQLNRLVRGAIQQVLPETLHVVGELSNLSRPAGGHWYFTLKDADGELRCVLWRSSATSVKFEPRDGMEVVVTGYVDVYEPRGQYQFYVRKIEPRGVGALELAFRQLKEKLAREGLFDPARKRPLPLLPRRIGVITSLTGAAVRDIVQTLARRFPCVTVYLCGVPVQGAQAAGQIAATIAWINGISDRLGGVDVLIVGRGGGSLEDLWAFNEETVARAIAASRIPVVSAVGHEVDFTIADFVADVRAATPTAAAELVTPVREELLTQLDGWSNRLGHLARRRIEQAAARLQLCERAAWFRDPRAELARRAQALTVAAQALKHQLSTNFSDRRRRLDDAEIRLHRVRPQALLARRREQLTEMLHRLRWAQGHANLLAERRLRDLTARLTAAGPQRLLEQRRTALDQLHRRLFRETRHLMTRGAERLRSLYDRLEGGSYRRILQRGFSVTRLERGGKIVRRAADAAPGDILRTETHDGEIQSRVSD